MGARGKRGRGWVHVMGLSVPGREPGKEDSGLACGLRCDLESSRASACLSDRKGIRLQAP